jgi:Ran GTPase-activating protein (RanGAP) involved in mRNA processing and transport
MTAEHIADICIRMLLFIGCSIGSIFGSENRQKHKKRSAVMFCVLANTKFLLETHPTRTSKSITKIATATLNMQSLLPIVFCLDHGDSPPLHPRQVHHTLCGRLTKNDPNIQTVEFRYQNIDLQRLAKAFAHNTILTTLELVASVQSIGGGLPSDEEEVEHIYYDDYDEHSAARDRCCDIMLQPPRWPLAIFFPDESYSGSSRGIYTLCYDGLIYNRALLVLDLSQNYLGRFGASCIQQALRNHPTLRRLNLSRCQLEDAGLQRLVNSKLGVLQELVLSHNQISDGGFLRKLLYINTDLKKLDLSFNHLTNFDCVQFVAIYGFASLQSLDLTSNRISHVGASALGKALRLSSTVLKELWLDGNPLGDVGVMHFGRTGLANNTSLVKLSLQKCNVGDTGVAILSQCLAKHQSMNELYLASNCLSIKGAMACLHTSLAKIDLAFNNIRGDRELISILRRSNVRLVDLNVLHNPMRLHRKRIDFWTTLNATGGRRLLQCHQDVGASAVGNLAKNLGASW